MAETSIYTVGGTVQANERGVYITRQADAELLHLCQTSTFAHVLTPRQMGKSSLMIRTAEQLIETGIQSVIIDLTQIGTQLTADEWYSDFLDLVSSQLTLTTNVKQWWQAHNQSGKTLRLTRFFQEVVLAEVSAPVVIFVDEIDTTLSLDFTDDFYATIRYLYVARSTDSALRRLSFVLIGVATPADLIRDPKRTPFNIGQRLDLTDFTFAEARPLAAGLGLPAPAAEQVLDWLLAWTGGHPYLTQRLCAVLVERQQTAWTKSAIDRLVADTFLGTMSRQDNNLQFVRDMLTRRAPDVEAVLTTYRQAWRGKPVEDEEQSITKAHLKLSGVVKRDDTDTTLIVRNPIYRRVFDSAWVQEHLPETWWQRLKPATPLLATMLVATLGMAGVTVYAVTQQYEAKRQERFAQENAQKFVLISSEFKAKSIEAQRLQRDAEQQRDRATRQEKEANRQRRRAEDGEEKATTALKQAETERQIAKASKDQALLSQQAEAKQRQIAELRQKEAEVSLAKMTQLLDDVSGIVQGDQVLGVVGFAPVQQKLFNALLPYHKDIIATGGRRQSGTFWRSAEAHFRIGRASETLGDGIKAEQELRLAFNGAKAASETLAFSKNLPPELLQFLNETALFYAWNRMNYGYLEEAESILNVAKSFSDGYTGEKSPGFIISLARLENVFSRLSSEQSNAKKSLEHQLLAIDLAKKAVSLDEKNIDFRRTLAVYLRNLSNTSESLMPKEEAGKYKQEGCVIARKADKMQGSGAALLDAVIACAYDESFQKTPDEIVKSLLDERARLNTVIQLDPKNITFKLTRAWITTRLIDVENYQRNDKKEADRYLQLALGDWLDVVGDGRTFPSDNVGRLGSIFNSLKEHLTSYEDTLEKERTFSKIVSAIDQTNNAFGESPEIALIAADSTLQLGELQKKSNPKESLANLNKAIRRFAKTSIFKDTSTYSDRYTLVCKAYQVRLSLYYESKNLEAVIADFKKINEICLPIFAKYSFDFYLHEEIRSAYSKTGELLFNKGQFAEAKPILKYASHWGIKSSTELLARMYREGLGVQVDQTQAKALEDLAAKQSMKRFTIPADFAGIKAPFNVSVYQKPSDYPYKGIDDQIEWLKQARGGTVPADVADSFRKLQKIADDNNVSFPDLVVYALEKPNEKPKPEDANPKK